MPRQPDILFSTTRQWNCGDEFILFGVRRLLDGLGFRHNPVIYNRHPSITPQRRNRRLLHLRAEPVPHYDNSFILDEPGLVDYVIFAGTPEWFGGKRSHSLHRYILDNDLRCAFLGVGVHRRHEFSADLKRILRERCDLITARDPLCYELIRDYPNAYQEVCPALFSAPAPTLREKLGRVGVVIQASKTRNHTIPAEVAAYCDEQFRRLETACQIEYVAHYLDDLKLARASGKPVHYSAYAEDYPAIFDRFDVVISTRVHGCGMAASLGIPTAMIPHDGRAETVQGFLSHMVTPREDLVGWIRSLDVRKISSAIINHREERFKALTALLKKHLSILH